MSDRIFANEHGLPFIEVEGEPRMLGCLPPDPIVTASAGFADFRDDFGTALPESQWEETSLRSFNPPQRDQKTRGSCTGQATVTAFTVAKKKSSQSKFDVLSATFIYGQINGGRDQGARVADAMVAIRDGGTCFDVQVPTDMIYRQQFPAVAFQTAKRFKALQVSKLSSYEELCTALSLGIPCASGIAVGRNFTRGEIASSGLAPLPDVVVGGHCLAHLGLKKLNGVWVVETMNSWGSTWGADGWCYLKKEHWSPGYGFPFDAFAIYSVIDDPEDPDDNPPPLVVTPTINFEDVREVMFDERRFDS